MTNYIWITTQKEIHHRYKDAPEDVSFLRNIHRHIFHFKVYIEVKSNDREIEFIQFKTFINDCLDEWKLSMDNASCEDMANNLYFDISEEYVNRKIKIEVSEDGENGVLFEFLDEPKTI
jgi:hypothetical protein